MRMIWLSCEGETAADEEHMGKVHYVPWQVDRSSKWWKIPFQNGEICIFKLADNIFSKWQKMLFLYFEQYMFIKIRLHRIYVQNGKI